MNSGSLPQLDVIKGREEEWKELIVGENWLCESGMDTDSEERRDSRERKRGGDY